MKLRKIVFPGRYRLTEQFVGLAADPVRFFESGDEFTVVEVLPHDFVVDVPEFGGWTHWRMPAEPIGWVRVRYAAKRLIPHFGVSVFATGLATWLMEGSEWSNVTSWLFFCVSVLYAIAGFVGTYWSGKRPVHRMALPPEK